MQHNTGIFSKNIWSHSNSGHKLRVFEEWVCFKHLAGQNSGEKSWLVRASGYGIWLSEESKLVQPWLKQGQMQVELVEFLSIFHMMLVLLVCSIHELQEFLSKFQKRARGSKQCCVSGLESMHGVLPDNATIKKLSWQEFQQGSDWQHGATTL